ncbi:MAG: glycosyltransferase family 25 protein [Ignavibacteria bacterium]|jgi:glycosyl transferase family 25|nr:glycosyltransferase family 25 protein [Ignavibacteria bacterium]
MKIFIINLETEINRRNSMIFQMDSINSDKNEFIFFNAINSQKIGIFFNKINPFFSKLIRGKSLTDGEIACFASHYSLWQKCLELKEDIVILEDDVALLPDFENGLDVIKKSPYNYTKLMCLFDKKSKKINGNFYITRNGVSGAQGYYLTPFAARQFIEKSRAWLYPVDDYLDSFWIHKIPTIFYFPYLIKENENSLNSTIKNRKSSINIVFKISREISRFILNIRKLFTRNISEKNII